MLILLLLFSTLHVVHTSCPNGFDIVRNGECRGKVASVVSMYNDEATEAITAKCETRQAKPVIIHDDQDNEYWKSKESWELAIGLTCNTVTQKWEWVDGSAMDFKPPKGSYDQELDQKCVSGCVWFISDSKQWQHKCGHSTYQYDIWCIAPLAETNTECDDFGDDYDDGVCYQIGKAAETFLDAQKVCRNYGAYLASIHNRKWIDGTPWDYSNFYPGFPKVGNGRCLSMDTLGGTGEWMNMNCTTKMAVACERQQNTTYADTCSQGPWKEGEIIHSPGYPFNASIPCDYFLSVDKGRRLEVTVHLLEANSCCDRLIMTDNYLGGKIIANLTGEVTEQTYTSWDTNFMRVSWLPNGGVNVKGVMMSYRAV